MMDMNFRIVEGGMDYDDFYDDFKFDFLNPKITINDLMDKYDISLNRYNTLRKRVCEELGLENKPNRNVINRSRNYVQKKGNKWIIVKKINGKKESFGMYSSLNTALKIRDELMKCGWDKKQLLYIREMVLLEEKLL